MGDGGGGSAGLRRANSTRAVPRSPQRRGLGTTPVPFRWSHHLSSSHQSALLSSARLCQGLIDPSANWV